MWPLEEKVNSSMLLAAEGISKTYQSKKKSVFENINIEIDSKEFVVIGGPSGSGKSTLLAILGGYLTPSNGHVYFRGEDIFEYSEDQWSDLHREKIGYVPQSNVMLKKYNIIENLALPFIIGNDKKDSFIQELKDTALKHLEKLEIADLADSYPSELSGGQLKRVAIARAMMMKPAIILADEPTSGLDKRTGKIILDYLKDYVSEGNTVIVATHDEDAYAYATKKHFLSE